MNPRKIRSTNAWKKTSELIRAKSPWCADPFGFHKITGAGAPVPAEATHHIEALAKNGSPFDEDNLLPVCEFCHKALHGGRGALATIKRAYTEAGIKPEGRGAFLLSAKSLPTEGVPRKKIQGIFQGGVLNRKDGVFYD